MPRLIIARALTSLRVNGVSDFRSDSSHGLFGEFVTQIPSILVLYGLF
jgi:hypothetical protein